MTGAACILLPLLLAAVRHWLPPWRWLSASVAGLTAALALSLSWLGDAFGGWLLTDPLAVHVTILSALAWLAASAFAALDGEDEPLAAVVAGCVNLALLADGAALSVVAAGAAALAACRLQPASRSPETAAVCSIGLAVFGLAVVGGAASSGPDPGRGSTGWPALSWSALPGAGAQARGLADGLSDGLALGVGFAALLLGLGCACTLLPVRAALRGAALTRTAAVLAGPLGGVWLVIALRLRGVLDGDGHAMAPGGPMVALALAGLALAAVCAWDRARLLPAAIVAMLAAALFGFGLGGAAATGAGLLHLTLGCLALIAAASRGWPAALGLASLAALPPFGLFASFFALLAACFARAPLLAVPFGLLLAAVALAALPLLAAPARPGRASPGAADPAANVGWAGLALAALGGWAMPPGVAAWLQGIAAAAQ